MGHCDCLVLLQLIGDEDSCGGVMLESQASHGVVCVSHCLKGGEAQNQLKTLVTT